MGWARRGNGAIHVQPKFRSSSRVEVDNMESARRWCAICWLPFLIGGCQSPPPTAVATKIQSVDVSSDPDINSMTGATVDQPGTIAISDADFLALLRQIA